MKLSAEGKFPIHQSQALLHACEAEPGPLHRLFGIKTKPRIRDGQIDLIHSTHERHLEVFCTAMLRDKPVVWESSQPWPTLTAP